MTCSVNPQSTFAHIILLDPQNITVREEKQILAGMFYSEGNKREN